VRSRFFLGRFRIGIQAAAAELAEVLTFSSGESPAAMGTIHVTLLSKSLRRKGIGIDLSCASYHVIRDPISVRNVRNFHATVFAAGFAYVHEAPSIGFPGIASDDASDDPLFLRRGAALSEHRRSGEIPRLEENSRLCQSFQTFVFLLVAADHDLEARSETHVSAGLEGIQFRA